MMHDAQAASFETPRFHILRHDTLLGPCQALGDELGFNPTLLRVALCALLFWNPAVIIGSYVGAAGFVALIDWLFPRTDLAAAPAAAAVAAPPVADPVPAEAQEKTEREPELVAA